MFTNVAATVEERSAPVAGDELVGSADVVMDRGFTIHAAPTVVWPWLVQLGKRRAGWYLPRSVERLIPRRRRATRRIEPRWQGLQVGDVIPDWGGRNATFEVAVISAPTTLVYRSRRGRTEVSWAMTLVPAADGGGTRVHLRLRLAPVERVWLARTAGEFLDLVTVAGMARGLHERVPEAPAPQTG